MSDTSFTKFRSAIDAQVAKMLKNHNSLFRMDISKDDIWQGYLSSFPEGTNPIFRERGEYECNCCKSWVRQIGPMVMIDDAGNIETVWDIKGDYGFFNVVADSMSQLVRSAKISNIFLHTEITAGTNVSRQVVNGKTLNWDHFYTKLPGLLVVDRKFIGTQLGMRESQKGVFQRALTELTLDSIDTVLELIAQNSLYRGKEHEFVLQEFRKVKVVFDNLGPDQQQDVFVWKMLQKVSASVSFIRNSVIGSLLIDLNEGKDLEYAVKSFETKVAPANYKRPTAPVTKSMIESAQKTVAELGFTDSLERRYAELTDITVNNILYADRNTKRVLEKKDVFGDLAASVPEKVQSYDKVEEIGIEDFIKNVVPLAESIEVMFENRHAASMVSLVAPVNPEAPGMFKWPNKFSWSYVGDLADSDIRAAVQARGGRVDGVFRFSHQWNYGKRNASLMDLHVFLPGSNHNPKDSCHDEYGNSSRVGWNLRNHATSHGSQDVDYTNAAPEGYIPVENITFPSLEYLQDGVYTCKIHNWNLRSPTLGGFKAEIEFGGQVFQYEVDRPLKHKEWVTVAKVTLRAGVFSIEHCLPTSTSSKQVWSLPTQNFHKVSVIMNSPNHWDEKAIGNKHYFFMLEGCKNEGVARGFYNEFLSEDLNKHRKVLEMVGSKMKTEGSANQLSGIGFSSTMRNSVLCRVKGKFQRVVKVVF